MITRVSTLGLALATTSALGGVAITATEHEGRAQFQIQTPTATYYYDKAGGGFSRLIDRDGKDWIAFKKDPLSQFPQSAAAGYRGIPNSVFGGGYPDAGSGHPGFDQCETIQATPNALRSTSKSGKWAWSVHFSDDEARLRFERVGEDHAYWFLYEGTPAGRFAPSEQFWGNDVDGHHATLPDIQNQAFGQWRWAYFGDRATPRVLGVTQCAGDTLKDTFWYLGAENGGAISSRDGMAVFGFGREVKSQPLLTTPHEFVIRFIETDEKRAHAAVAKAFTPVRAVEETLFGDMECFRVTTPSATYVYGKRGAGFASVIDPAGKDWISYKHGGKAMGEYRGMPKCGQPTKYFHCGYGYGQYQNDNPFHTTWEQIAPDHGRLKSETKNGDAACAWDIYADHATMTLLRIPGKYWFLYEGTPGGKLDADKDFVLRPGKKSPLTERWLEDTPWLLFGAGESPHGLFLRAHQPAGPSSYVGWPYKPDPDGLDQMTVTGFGRPAWDDPKQHTPPLETLPARFTIAITPTADEAAALKFATK
jgi:hypothetical protein